MPLKRRLFFSFKSSSVYILVCGIQIPFFQEFCQSLKN
ncbi:hypothetical protein LEP1GSC060_2536 [Leptospira weilii serovar Ranarum str. ICFT]|uniref:Uncharacterized protein n=1 Tax=Leptospira weilii serovar Ranarum str. ICFT TaxID=1218598 RepID=N1WQD1_9LEPT|nr:hypothetical protein LEP1GSC060_2536 [Leptospira weilii serovar Ranarum str. ICFT]